MYQDTMISIKEKKEAAEKGNVAANQPIQIQNIALEVDDDILLKEDDELMNDILRQLEDEAKTKRQQALKEKRAKKPKVQPKNVTVESETVAALQKKSGEIPKKQAASKAPAIAPINQRKVNNIMMKQLGKSAANEAEMVPEEPGLFKVPKVPAKKKPRKVDNIKINALPKIASDKAGPEEPELNLSS
ncbi:uncharacterized protein LOC117890617 [Drosophila subobscura]|uniref:uncharacterized protein LOC117890617 n=1 Tax=Drosophila subobscura TaxID=7241 RepID=UPI00155AB163|nr:uncharacterized protein LOC117890617 [Drosophila subobscura]